MLNVFCASKKDLRWNDLRYKRMTPSSKATCFFRISSFLHKFLLIIFIQFIISFYLHWIQHILKFKEQIRNKLFVFWYLRNIVVWVQVQFAQIIQSAIPDLIDFKWKVTSLTVCIRYLCVYILSGQLLFIIISRFNIYLHFIAQWIRFLGVYLPYS